MTTADTPLATKLRRRSGNWPESAELTPEGCSTIANPAPRASRTGGTGSGGPGSRECMTMTTTAYRLAREVRLLAESGRLDGQVAARAKVGLAWSHFVHNLGYEGLPFHTETGKFQVTDGHRAAEFLHKSHGEAV